MKPSETVHWTDQLIQKPQKRKWIIIRKVKSVQDKSVPCFLCLEFFFDLTVLTVPQFRCCGVTNHTDWFEVYNASRVPDSCCLEYSDNCGLDNPGTWWTAVSSCSDSKGGNLNTTPVFGGQTDTEIFGSAFPNHDYKLPHIFAREDKMPTRGRTLF